MTVCAAIKKDGKVYIGADSFFGSFWNIDSSENVDKITEFETFMVARSGDGNLADALEELRDDNISRKIESKSDARNFMVEVLSKQKSLYDKGNHTPREKEESFSNCSLLIATPNTIYQVYGNLNVVIYEKFNAIGAGLYYALGALEALYDSNLSGKKILEKVLTSACKLSPLCKEPLVIKEVK